MSQVAQRRTAMLASTAPIEPDAVSASSPPIEADAFTIGEFCKRNRISPPTYFKLRQAGLGPPEMRIGTVVRISREAAAAWRAARENPVGAEAEAVAAS